MDDPTAEAMGKRSPPWTIKIGTEWVKVVYRDTFAYQKRRREKQAYEEALLEAEREKKRVEEERRDGEERARAAASAAVPNPTQQLGGLIGPQVLRGPDMAREELKRESLELHDLMIRGTISQTEGYERLKVLRQKASKFGIDSLQLAVLIADWVKERAEEERRAKAARDFFSQ